MALVLGAPDYPPIVAPEIRVHLLLDTHFRYCSAGRSVRMPSDHSASNDTLNWAGPVLSSWGREKFNLPVGNVAEALCRFQSRAGSHLDEREWG